MEKHSELVWLGRLESSRRTRVPALSLFLFKSSRPVGSTLSLEDGTFRSDLTGVVDDVETLFIGVGESLLHVHVSVTAVLLVPVLAVMSVPFQV